MYDLFSVILMEVYNKIRQKGKYIIASLVLPVMFISFLAANEEPDSLDVRKIYDIEGIRVISDVMSKTIGAVDFKNINERSVNTGTDVGNLIKDMSGVYLSERGKGESVVRFRGFEDRHIRVLVDGMPISSGYFGNYDLHLIAADNISQINLIKGPVSHRYGFNTLGGLLNIVTDDMEEVDTFQAKFQVSNHGNFQTSFNGSYALGRSQLYLSGSSLNISGFVLPQKKEPLGGDSIEEGGEKRTQSARDQYTANVRLITDIAGLHTFTINSGYSYMPRKGNPPSIYEHPDNHYNKIEDWQRFNLSIAGNTNLFDAVSATASAYYDQSEDNYLRYFSSSYERILYSSLIKNNTLGFSFDADYEIPDIMDSSSGFRTEIKEYNRTGGPGYENTWVDNSQSMMKFYHSLTLPAGEKNLLSFTFDNAVSGYTHSKTNKFNWYWEPQANLILYSKDKSLSLAYGYSNQFPTMRQLFSSSSGNPQLKPERGRKLESRLRSPLPYFRYGGVLTLTLFYNMIEDLIERDRIAFYNIDRMSTYGSEINLNFSFLPNLYHDYEISLLRLDEDNSSVSLMEYPEMKLRFAHHYEITDDLVIGQSTQWYDERVTLYRDEDHFTLPAYWKHDLGLKYFYRRASITLNVTNLLDNYFEPQYGYPAPGREITFALGFRFF